MGRYLSLVWKNTLRNRRRSILTISSMALSLCLLGLMMAIYFALYLSDTPPEQALRMATRNRVAITLPIPAFYLDRVLKTPGVREAMPWQWFGGTYKDARDPANFFARMGVDAQKLFSIFTEIKISEDEKKAFQADRRSCIIGQELAKKHGFKLGDRINLVGDIYPMDLELFVKGIYDSSSGSETLFFHWQNVRDALPERRRDLLSSISILADSADSVPRIITAIDDQFRNSTQQTRTETERAFGLGFLNMVGNIKAILAAICSAVIFTVMLVSANTMAMSVRERVREIGILKTLGFKPRAILGIILSEAMLIALFGGIVGYLLASGLCFVVRQGPAFSAQIKTLSIQPPVALAMFFAAVGIAVLSSFIPAWSASRVNILDALRQTN